MDPNANLRAQREIVARINNGDGCDSDDILRLAELVEALDQWLTGGGFLPAAWTPGHKPLERREHRSVRERRDRQRAEELGFSATKPARSFKV